ncbi:hypothetical protein [Mycolicibacterium vinylchloridicum]|uniref:hypothetical protein n=1 Tax=Mycolicibacterium vinylchloridicum TaxID=2736928 RepID=UPI0015C9B53B|nr:hypothetical protein [Mycolicibacterium vinylchloridicum]
MRDCAAGVCGEGLQLYRSEVNRPWEVGVRRAWCGHEAYGDDRCSPDGCETTRAGGKA